MTKKGNNNMARDYRSFNKYDIDQIYYDELESKEWLGKRMAFLWEARDYYTKDYLSNNLNEELQLQFYGINDSDISKYAGDAYYGCKDYDLTDNEVINEYIKLLKLHRCNRKEFLLKKNKLKYDYCSIQMQDRELYQFLER